MARLIDTFSGFAYLAVVVTAGYLLARIVYNLYFHPLARFPGPVIFRATRLAWARGLLRGTLPRDILALHDKYGPVVRVAPDELVFISPDAWKDIYGHRVGSASGQDELAKDETFYRLPGDSPSIVTENRERHAVLRRQLAHGFSERSLRGQEPIIGGYVDLLVKRLKDYCVETVEVDGELRARPKALNMVAWYNWTTFDVIGDLAFGEPFGCLEKAEYHPWVGAINEAVTAGGVVQVLKYLGLKELVGLLVKLSFRARDEHKRRTRQLMLKRMAMDVERPDLIEGLLRKKSDLEMPLDSLVNNADILIIAGSETTATLLSGATYLLLTNPAALARATAEVRGAFQSESDITLTSVSRLSYLLACLTESLRRYPPVPTGLPRVVGRGGTGVTIAGQTVPPGTVVSVWQWPAYHSEQNWTDPFGFHPERWLRGGDDENNAMDGGSTALPPEKFRNDRFDALQPFSVGPRNCIGRNLAYAEMRLILARILFNFDIRLADENIDWMDSQEAHILWKKTPLPVYLTPVQ